jgi:lipopolysaccharide transport system ATP-binding protein
MSSEIAIRVEGLGKCYQIYDKPRDRLLQMLVRGRKRYYREFWALRDVSFEVVRGRTLGIIGRNGSGKSTLLQMICGVLNPTTGTLETRGRIASMLELGAGFNPEFTGRENVFMSGALHGLSRAQVEERFDRIAAFADIGAFIDQPVKTYSSGMFVRLAFAVIAHVDADILVIDEALAVGDAFFVQKCMRFLREFAATGTLIFVSHDVGAVLNLCDTAIWLQDGRLVDVGSPKALTERYLQALYEAEQGPNRIAGAAQAAVDPAAPEAAAAVDAPPGPGPATASADARTPDRAAAPALRDQRQDLLNQSRLRNDIEVFEFRPDSRAFGTAHALIESVRIEDVAGRPLSWMVGGEEVVVAVEARANAPLSGPIVGFVVKDRLGQVLFSDNTYLTTLGQPLAVAAGQRVTARFRFVAPRLPNGDYAISAAIAEGTQDNHVQHHWMHDALAFRVHATSVFVGLVGIPMNRIELTVRDDPATITADAGAPRGAAT